MIYCTVTSYPIPNSSILVFPTIVYPLRFIFSTTVASYFGWKFQSSLDAQVVLLAALQKLSFTLTRYGEDGGEDEEAVGEEEED